MSVNLQEDIDVGVGCEHDTKELKKGLFQCVYTLSSSKYWMRADMMNQLFSAGCDQSLNDNVRHSFEAVYNTAKTEAGEPAKGFMGQAGFVRFGVEYDLSDATTLEGSGKLSDQIEFEQTVTHQCNSNWTVSATQGFDSGRLGTTQGAYSLGFGVTYKL